MTARPLAYKVSKNILQYLSLEKRTEIAISCPSVRTAERKADMYLHHLHLDNQYLKINDVTYRCCKYRDEPEKCSVVIERGIEEIQSRVHVDMKVDDAMKKLFDFWLGNRGVVKVQILEVINGYQGVFLPKNLKIECKQLRLFCWRRSLVKPEEHQRKTLQFISQFLTNIRLHKLTMFDYNGPDPIFQQDLVRTATILEIIKFTPREKSIVSELVQLTNQQIHVRGAHTCFAVQDVVTLARSWLEKCPKSGTRFKFRLGYARIFARC